MQYIEHISATAVVTHVPATSCTFKVTEAAVSVTGNNGAKITATRKVTHFSPNAATGGPTIPAVVLATGVKARLGYFNNNGHFNYITDESVGA
jgi:hypothetical protein